MTEINKRKHGYYWVKVKSDENTKDLLSNMGLLSPHGNWVICYYSALGWEYRHFDIEERYFEFINENRLLAPDEITL